MFAYPVKIDPVRIDLPLAAGGCGIHHGINVSHPRKIVNVLTAGADEMVMPLHVCVKAVSTITCRDLYDLPHLSQQSEVSINSAETDVRVLFTEAGVDCVGSRVIGTAS